VIALIGCGAHKARRAAPAREFYQGTMFQHAVIYVEQVLDVPWYALSAGHGLVHPDQVLEPYDVTLPTERNSLERRMWAWRVAQQLLDLGLNVCGQEWLILAGRLYRDPLEQYLRGRIVAPLRGRVGQQVAWLKEQTERSHEG